MLSPAGPPLNTPKIGPLVLNVSKRKWKPMPEEPDCALLRRFVAGEQDAFEALFRQFQPEVYRWILYILRDANHTKDVVIETFWRAYRGRARFDSSRSFGAWMRRIATNAACDCLQTMRHSRLLEERERFASRVPPALLIRHSETQ